MGFRLIASGLIVAATIALFASTAQTDPVTVPDFSAAELKCQKATLTGTVQYLKRAFAARQACFDMVEKEQLPPTVDCRAPVDTGTGNEETDNALSSAEAGLAVAIQTNCQNVHLENLGFPGLCPDPYGPPYDSFDHEQCMLDRANSRIDRLLDIEHPPFPGPRLLLSQDTTCANDAAVKSSHMYSTEIEDRTVNCELKRLQYNLPQEVNCRAEIDPLAPGTGDDTVDTNIVQDHNDVLRGIANSCKLADLTLLGFPHRCPNPPPDGSSLFSIAALTECMYKTHHFDIVDFVDGMIPSTKMCGNCVIDAENGEECDDGNNTWKRGEVCRFNCSLNSTCGDPDDSGGITIRDALFILRAAVGLEMCDLSLCDINGDGKFNTTDALLALRAVVGLPVDLHCNPPQKLSCAG